MKVDLSFPSKPSISLDAKSLISRVSNIPILAKVNSFSEQISGLSDSNLWIDVASGERLLTKALSSEDNGASLDNQECRSYGYLLVVRT